MRSRGNPAPEDARHAGERGTRVVELTPERLAAQLADEPLRPVYLVAGPEPLRVLEAADAIRSHARGQGIAEREVFDAEGNPREPDWDAFYASLRAPGLFSTRRLLELRLPTGKPGKRGAEEIIAYCADPAADVCLLITCDEWSRQHGGKWSEAVAGIGRVAVAWTVKPHELAGWIEARLRSSGLRAEPDAVQCLVARVEGNLLAAAQEIDKLVLLFAQEQAASRDLRQSGPLSVEMMESCVADAARFDVFRLLDAALNGQGAHAARMLAGLRAEGAVVPALMGMVVMELQRAATLARVSARGDNPGSSPGQALAAAFKAQRVWDARQAVYRRALQRHDAARWERFLAEAGRIDRIAKGRGRPGLDPDDAWQVLERLLLAIAEPRARVLLAS